MRAGFATIPSAILMPDRLKGVEHGTGSSQRVHRFLATQAQRLRVGERGDGYAAIRRRAASGGQRGQQGRVRGGHGGVQQRSGGRVPVRARPRAARRRAGPIRPRQAAPHPRHRPSLGLDGDRFERFAPQRGVSQAPRGTRRARHGRGEGRRLRARCGALREDGAELRRRVSGRGHGQRGHRAARGTGECAHSRALSAP